MIAHMFRPNTRFLFSLLFLAALFALAGCGQIGQEVTPTLVIPAVVPTMPPTAVPPTPTLLPTNAPATVTPPPTPCAFAVLPALAAAYNEDDLGCPTSAGLEATSTAYAPFEGGQMLWRGDTDTIYVLNNDGGWTSYPNQWREGDPEYTCGEENSPPTPVRGFGRVWCEQPGVREAMRAVTAYEIGDNASPVQDFDGGTILSAPWGSLFVFRSSGNWQRVEVGE